MKDSDASVLKVVPSQGLVLGWAIVCKQDGVDYFDLQDDHIPEDTMLEAATDFAAGSRVMKVMHEGSNVGQVTFMFPMTTDVAKAFGFSDRTTGLMVGMKPDSEAILKRYVSGEYTGFSIGGKKIDVEPADVQ